MTAGQYPSARCTPCQRRQRTAARSCAPHPASGPWPSGGRCSPLCHTPRSRRSGTPTRPSSLRRSAYAIVLCSAKTLSMSRQASNVRRSHTGVVSRMYAAFDMNSIAVLAGKTRLERRRRSMHRTGAHCRDWDRPAACAGTRPAAPGAPPRSRRSCCGRRSASGAAAAGTPDTCAVISAGQDCKLALWLHA